MMAAESILSRIPGDGAAARKRVRGAAVGSQWGALGRYGVVCRTGRQHWIRWYDCDGWKGHALLTGLDEAPEVLVRHLGAAVEEAPGSLARLRKGWEVTP